jgi:Lipopolysaccharide-assembly
VARRLTPLLVAIALAPAGCSGRGFTFAGYTVGPTTDPEIKSVYVPVFKMIAPATTPFRYLDQDITRAVVKELNTRPGMRVVSNPDRADTELVGTIVRVDKLIFNRNPQNMWRDGDVQITVQIMWKDLRSGRILTNRGAPPPPGEILPFDPNLPVPPAVPVTVAPLPVSVTAAGRFVPELGETTTTGAQTAVDRIARQIVNMMEAPW